ncbi:MAG: ABC transporter permease [Magnetococcales bacterium]|nr:ABC transporter permease [Magnetococcales bacterium]NGZ26318.1 ABC transporter permease [Magnetococcales bacterium]
MDVSVKSSSHLNAVASIGQTTLDLVQEMGRMALFLFQGALAMVTPPFRFQLLLKQISFIGIHSLFVIVLTAVFTGMVLGLQGYYTLSRFGSEALLGPAVALSIIRELGPVLTGLMVTGRAGSALTAELGIMRIREQVDALHAMGINPIKYLVAPRMEAGLLVLPLLTAIFDLVGIYGGYLVAVQLLGMSSGTYFGGIETALLPKDLWVGLLKAFSFGLIITWVCTYKGYTTSRGAEGVSRSTTSAVVLSSVLILVWDYFVTSVML